MYNDNWGETLGDKSFPVLCVLNIETTEVSVLGDIPGHLSPGQVSIMQPGKLNWEEDKNNTPGLCLSITLGFFVCRSIYKRDIQGASQIG